MSVYIANENFSPYEKNISDDIFDSLIEYFEIYKKSDLHKLVVLVNSEKQLDKLIDNYGLNINEHDIYDRWRDKEKWHLIGSLIKHNFNEVELERFALYVLKEYGSMQENLKENPKIPANLIAGVIHIIKQDELLKRMCERFNPIDLVLQFNEYNISIEPYLSIYYNNNTSHFSERIYSEVLLKGLVENAGLEKVKDWIYKDGENHINLSAKNAIIMLKAGFIPYSELNILCEKGKGKPPFPLYELLFDMVEHIGLLAIPCDENQFRINPQLDLSLMSKNATEIIFDKCLGYDNYFSYVYNLLPSDKYLLKNDNGHTILHHVANARNLKVLGSVLRAFIKRGVPIDIFDNNGKNFVANIHNPEHIFALVTKNKIFNINAPEHIKIKNDLLNREETIQSFASYHVKKVIADKEKIELKEMLNTDSSGKKKTQRI